MEGSAGVGVAKQETVFRTRLYICNICITSSKARAGQTAQLLSSAVWRSLGSRLQAGRAGFRS